MTAQAKPHKTASYTRMTGEVYDLIYSHKDYESGAAGFADLIKNRSKSGGKHILEVACGTGTYLKYLSEEFAVDGMDLSQEQVEAAKKKLPGANIIQADMRDFNMGRQYDAVLCVFSSIGYLSTNKDLDETVANIVRHTKPGGAVIIEPWYRAENFRQEDWLSFEVAATDGDLSVACMCLVSCSGKHTNLVFHHMVGTASGIDHFIERHTMTMYTGDDFSRAFAKAGLVMEYDPVGPSGRGLYVGARPL